LTEDAGRRRRQSVVVVAKRRNSCREKRVKGDDE